jgi:mannosyltransferase OCH1-like enzyme
MHIHTTSNVPMLLDISLWLITEERTWTWIWYSVDLRNVDRGLQRCHRRLDSLRSYSAWLRGTSPVGISNDSMGTSPNHPFYLRVIEKLQKYARNWRLPYLTVMLSTGPLFLSIMWKEYLMSSPPEHLRVAILPEQWYLGYECCILYCKV